MIGDVFPKPFDNVDRVRASRVVSEGDRDTIRIPRSQAMREGIVRVCKPVHQYQLRINKSVEYVHLAKEHIIGRFN
jgi:hypothetical protein